MRRKLSLLMVAVLGILSAQTTRKHVQTESDLPRFSYPLAGNLQTLLNSDKETFMKFATPVGVDVDAILRDYDIDDHASMIRLLETKLNLDIISGADDQAALGLISRIRALETKPAARLLDDMPDEAYLRSRMAAPASQHGCPEGYEALYRSMVQALPWEVSGISLKSEKGQLEILTPGIVVSAAEAELSPMLEKNHALTLNAAEEILFFRAHAMEEAVCNKSSIKVLSAYIQEHDVTRPDIWEAREVVLSESDKLTPVNVAIWDSGFDTSLFDGRLYTDRNPGGNDPHGVAFDVFAHHTNGELIPLTPELKSDYPAVVSDMQGFSDLEAGLDSPASEAIKKKLSALSPQQGRHYFEELQILGSYAHGTHVTGIAARGNPAIRLAYGRITYDSGSPHMVPTDKLQQDVAASYMEAVSWFRAHGMRVVNMSWWDWPASIEKDLGDNGVGKDAAERKALAKHYFDIERDGLYQALKSAPEILFVTIAGNSNEDNAFQDIIPSSFRLPNLLVTGAVDQAGDETNFTSYGQNVQVYADGLAVESVVPGGAKVRDSGTSMAAPQVTNLAAKLLAINPKLSPEQLIDLISKGSDTSKDGRLHLINPKRSVELLSK